MTKTTTCFAIILIAGFAMLKLIDVQADAQDSLPEIVAQDRKVQDLSVNYYTFKRSFDATLISLAKGEVALADAMEHVDDIAMLYNPDYITHLQYSETGPATKERIARNLVGHIAAVEEVIPNPNSRLAHLKVELNEVLRRFEGNR